MDRVISNRLELAPPEDRRSEPSRPSLTAASARRSRAKIGRPEGREERPEASESGGFVVCRDMGLLLLRRLLVLPQGWGLSFHWVLCF